MDCFAYSTASTYTIFALSDHFKRRFKTTLYRDVLHVSISLPGVAGDIFFMPYGTVVSWGIERKLLQEFLKELVPFEQESLQVPETDDFTFEEGHVFSISHDHIILPDDQVLSKLALSHGIAQSTKLSSFEVSIQQTINQVKHLPVELEKYGRIPLSRREIRRKMGALFVKRSSINLHVDALDTPEFFWEHPDLEPFYSAMAKYLDLHSRSEALNQRLSVVHELFEMLGSEVNHQYSSRLELTIICLILIEVLLTISKDML